ncbi:hypothetical protein CKO25_09600 [Thiocapsa imhoffii]|uniref:Glycosyltransferase n=1 Tax=Thiocapsa imhoffii TaxID=382777 RepID=A0A9X1B8H0_9GAMM|nr:class I SAM-dependent methyltransferase [Thiocapsa imhoffii]MBK1644899.1 hypothetical protein [Thiocapsa imhoffii]
MDYETLARAATIRPDALNAPSAWSGHVPFAMWLVQVLKPGILVELGTHYGRSYFNFCRSVKAGGLPTKCYAVDTWEGDAHAGHYGEAVFATVNEHNRRCYADVSRLLRMRFDEAVDSFANGSIDLLHIDGFHTYEAVKHDFEHWLPKLSAHAVVLFHDTNVRERGFGVWRLWEELRARYPLHLEFLHSHGLGVLQLDAGQAHARLDWLCPESAERALLLAYFGARGGELEQLDAARDELAVYRSERDALGMGRSIQDRVREGEQRIDALQHALMARAEEARLLRQTLARHESILSAAVQVAAERDALLASTSWRITRPIRALVNLTRRDPPSLAAAPQPREQGEDVSARGMLEAGEDWTHAAVGGRQVQGHRSDRVPGPRVLYISGEPHTPGHHYRVECDAQAARAVGAHGTLIEVAAILSHLEEVAAADLVVLWRTPWTEELALVIQTARAAGAWIHFDIDDLLFDPTLASTALIDGNRTQGLALDTVATRYARMRQTLLQVDLCRVTTEELAQQVRTTGVPVVVLPNGYDETTFNASRLAVRERAASLDDGLVRIGYAGGSRTHQRDFAVCADAVARILQDRPEVRLVLFRDPSSGLPLVELNEFPPLRDCQDRIEWRDLVPFRGLAAELARFDLNLAPLEIGNPFCEGKSELKYFEAALAGVCTLASPTGPFRRVIRHGETGWLAADPEQWREGLTRLLDDPSLRQTLARDALESILWPFGPEQRTERMHVLLGHLRGRRASPPRTVSFAQLRGRRWEPVSVPAGPSVATRFARDQLNAAALTLILHLPKDIGVLEQRLAALLRQPAQDLDLILLADAGGEVSLERVLLWAGQEGRRFHRLLVLEALTPSELGPLRNLAITRAETFYVLPLGPHQWLGPDAAQQALMAIRAAQAAFACPLIVAADGGAERARHEGVPRELVLLFSKAAWTCVGGYAELGGGGDLDLLRRFAEAGLGGVGVGEEPLAFHDWTQRLAGDAHARREDWIAEIERAHPGLAMLWRTPRGGPIPS